jgi:hypothetical protein
VGFFTSSPQHGVEYQLQLKELFGVSLNIPWKISDCKVLAHFGFKSKVLPRFLTDLSVWVGFCTL